MKIFLGADHAGFEMKGWIHEHLTARGYVVEDCGATQLVYGDDYPTFMHVVGARLSDAVARDELARAIVFGASGQGEAIVMNRYPHVRAVVYYGEPKTVQRDASGHELSLLASTRMHNDANCLSIGARFLTRNEVVRACDEWLATPKSEEERHGRRIAAIER